MTLLVRPLRSGEQDEALACYERNGYGGGLRDEDTVVVGVAEGRIVGVGRLAEERGLQLLRGMFLDEEFRRRGLGTRMLHALTARMEPRDCWLISGPHLMLFYAQAGFSVADNDAPAWMCDRAAGYEPAHGPQHVLRRRAPEHTFEIHPRTEHESWEAITDLLHRAYAPLAARGLRYVASHQGADVTQRRAARGECWVALQHGVLVATATLAAPGKGHGPEIYAESDVAKLEQFGVDPDLQGAGLATRVLARLEERARELGARRLALDTAEPAQDLIGWYERRSFVPVGSHDWRPHVNYTSVVLAKNLSTGSPP